MRAEGSRESSRVAPVVELGWGFQYGGYWESLELLLSWSASKNMGDKVVFISSLQIITNESRPDVWFQLIEELRRGT